MISVVSRQFRLFAAAASIAAILALFAAPAQSVDAHPLGNFTVNRYSRLELYSDTVRVHYVLDMAEIPAFQERSAVDADGNGDVSFAEADLYATTKGNQIAGNLHLTVGGDDRQLRLVLRNLAFPEGQAGLDTLRLSLVFEAASPEGSADVVYEDANYNDRLGWREVVVQPSPGAILTGDVPTQDASAALTDYPEGQLSSPLSVSAVEFRLDASGAESAPSLSGAAIAPAPEQAAGRSADGFAGLIDANDLTLTVVLIALLAAFGFGAIHALEPGHGKTLVAAYFVGVKGTARQALGLGAIIAVTHSVGVLAIGSITMFASQWVLPEKLYPWLSLASGVMVLLLGLRLIAARGGIAWLRRAAHRILPHSHEHDHHNAHSPTGGIPPWRALVALGLADGLTPSPSALVVLLAAVSLDRIGLGIGLIVAFSVGLATVLGTICLALVYARSVAEWLSSRFGQSGPASARVAALVTPDGAMMRLLPIGGACTLIVVGALLTVRALAGTGLAIL
jgi:ABC-type nickel/cobalt efflux system permease component RcnA